MIYIVTDIECDGGTPGVHSMISFAFVAVRETGPVLSEFEAVLTPLDGATEDERAMAWWAKQPEALAAATANPVPAADVMAKFVEWIRGFEAPPVFVAHPLAFDGGWMDYYLRRFKPYALLQGFYEEDKLFRSTGLCLRSYAAAILARPVTECDVQVYPPEWLGNHAHTHRAIDDARGYAHLLQKLFAVAKARA
jgi:DNA polymerase III epsilon subunit-like protein